MRKQRKPDRRIDRTRTAHAKALSRTRRRQRQIKQKGATR